MQLEGVTIIGEPHGNKVPISHNWHGNTGRGRAVHTVYGCTDALQDVLDHNGYILQCAKEKHARGMLNAIGKG